MSEANARLAAALERHKRGELQAAYAEYKSVLAQYPDHPQALHYLGLIAQQAGRSREAADLLRRSIQIDPTDPRAYNHLGQVLLIQKETQAALECFERAVAVDPAHTDSLNSLANVLKKTDAKRAIELYRRVLELEPAATLAAYNLGNVLRDEHAYEEALASFRRVIEIDPDHHQAHQNLGILLEQRGRFDEAATHYQAVRRIQPRHVGAIANLLALRSFRPDAQTVVAAEACLAAADLQDDERVKLHQGLGKHYDRSEQFERAFTHFAAAKSVAARRGSARFDRERLAGYVDRLIETFSAEWFQSVPRGSESQRPVFIVGLPRSGTSLAEQILASHPLAFGAGELQDIPAIARTLQPAYPGGIASMDAGGLRQLADRYLARIEALAPAGAQRVTDKLPVNFTHLGLIATLFPSARLVHCRRNPLDIALSCFIEQFEMERDFTTSFEDFGAYYLQYERLMAHWRKVLPTPMHEQRYEELIAAPEAQTRALVAFCGLDWDPACLEFHATERTVATPSRWQVRQPLYSSSVGRWRSYAVQLEPLRRALETAGHGDQNR